MSDKPERHALKRIDYIRLSEWLKSLPTPCGRTSDVLAHEASIDLKISGITGKNVRSLIKDMGLRDKFPRMSRPNRSRRSGERLDVLAAILRQIVQEMKEQGLPISPQTQTALNEFCWRHTENAAIALGIVAKPSSNHESESDA